MGFFWIIPFLVKNMFFVNKKRPGRKKTLRLRLRNILEFKNTRQYIGISLAFLLFLFSIVQVPDSSQVVAAANTIIDSESKIETIITEKSFQVPVIGYISQFFTGYHPGIDYAGNYLASIYPISEGNVISIEYGYLGYGNSILVDHGNGLISRYAHLHKINVNLGQVVDKSTEIGLVGSTGWSTGPHLHLETIYMGEKINPLSLIR